MVIAPSITGQTDIHPSVPSFLTRHNYDHTLYLLSSYHAHTHTHQSALTIVSTAAGRLQASTTTLLPPQCDLSSFFLFFLPTPPLLVLCLSLWFIFFSSITLDAPSPPVLSPLPSSAQNPLDIKPSNTLRRPSNLAQTVPTNRTLRFASSLFGSTACSSSFCFLVCSLPPNLFATGGCRANQYISSPRCYPHVGFQYILSELFIFGPPQFAAPLFVLAISPTARRARCCWNHSHTSALHTDLSTCGSAATIR